jgi:hypothetical protein
MYIVCGKYTTIFWQIVGKPIDMPEFSPKIRIVHRTKECPTIASIFPCPIPFNLDTGPKDYAK